MELICKQTYITTSQDRAIKRLAQQQSTTEAEILRKALDEFLIRKGIAETTDPFEDLIGMVAGPFQRWITMISTSDIRRILVDTSAWIDLMNQNERHHDAAVTFHKSLPVETLRLTTWGIVSETFTWLPIMWVIEKLLNGSH